MKIGDEFYSYSVDDNGKVELETHVLRTIRGKYAYAIHKHEFTWGKRSGKAGDYGWLDPIWPEWRTEWRIAGDRPTKRATSKLMAIRQAIKDHQRWSEPDDYPDPTMHAKALKTLQAMETRIRNASAKKRWKAPEPE